MIWRLALIALLGFGGIASAELLGPVGSGGPGFKLLGGAGTGSGPPPLVTPMVAINTCNITTPVTTGFNVALVGGGTCTYTATCGIAGPCTGGNAITSWAITTQSVAGAFSLTSPGGVVQGGANAASVTVGSSYTVTVTATNATGTSVPQLETINAPPVPIAPTVVAGSCTITLPVTNGTLVTLAGGGNCTFTALCAGVACVAGNAITSWAVVSQTCANCFAMDSTGDVLGSTGAATVAGGNTYTMNVTATNAIGTSAQQVQSIIVPGASSACNGVLDLSVGCMIAGMGP